MQKIRAVAFAGAVAMCMSVAVAPSASASDISKQESIEASQNAVGVEDAGLPFVKEGDTLVARDLDSAIKVEKIETGEVVVTFAEQNVDNFGFVLPEQPKDLALEKSVSPVISSNSDVDFVARADSDSAQVHAVIKSRDADEKIEFPLHGADTVEITEDGGALIYKAGEVVGYVQSPWAVDANGVPVETYFETNGDILTQVVLHKSGDYAYPIVADPDWGTIWEGIKKSGKKVWSGTKWVAGKGKVLAKRLGPGAFVFCLGGGYWGWRRSDADGWVRVGDSVAGCLF